MHQSRVTSLAGTTAISLIAGVVLLGGQAFGTTTTDWSLGQGGLYTSTGSQGVLTASGIPATSITGDGTPVKNGSVINILNGILDFTSGSYNGNGSNWSWGSGGQLTLTGCIAGVTASFCNGLNNVNLLTDSFQSLQIVSQGGFTDAVFGNITGSLNSKVASYFGVSTIVDAASFSTTMTAIGSPGLGLVGSNQSGMIKADPPTTSSHVPENWSIVESIAFFGLASLLFSLLLRFRILRLPAIS
jgi:hypothetical protein